MDNQLNESTDTIVQPERNVMDQIWIGSAGMGYAIYLGIMYTFVGLLGMLVYESIVQALFPGTIVRSLTLIKSSRMTRNYASELKQC